MSVLAQRILEFNSDRIPQILPLKYALMREDAFRFYRGTCHLFFQDLAKNDPFPEVAKIWMSGDLHLENFGSYKGDNRLVYFDINDFDESILGPVTWEITRLLTSIYLASGVLKLDPRQSHELAQSALENYLNVLSSGKALAVETATSSGLLKYFLEKVSNRKKKDLLADKVLRSGGNWRIRIDQTRYLSLEPEKRSLIRILTQKWMENHYPKKHFKVLDAAFRIAGLGSLGLERFV
ncbi:MAG: DUF2252 family protein, partial [Chitinophagaceae bacterium]